MIQRRDNLNHIDPLSKPSPLPKELVNLVDNHTKWNLMIKLAETALAAHAKKGGKRKGGKGKDPKMTAGKKVEVKKDKVWNKRERIRTSPKQQ